MARTCFGGDMASSMASAEEQEGAPPPQLRLLLFGATGNVGRHCLSALLAEAAPSLSPSPSPSKMVVVVVATRDPEAFEATYRQQLSNEYPTLDPAVVETVQCDAGDPQAIAAVIASVAPTRVFISMAQALGPEAMVACGQACVDACAAAGVSRLVRLSSLGIDVAPGQGPLGDAHLAIEAHAATEAPGQ